jgi:hypothetical protein
MDHRQNEITLIFGKKWCGKSRLARQLIATAEKRIIIDPMWEHTQGAIVRSFAALVAYVRPRRHERYAVVLQCTNDVERDRTLQLLTAGTPDRPPLAGVTVLIDEADRISRPTNLPEHIARLPNYGRHFGVSLMLLARRPQGLHRDFRAAADRIFVGQMQEPGDCDYLSEFIGPELAERAKTLRPDEFVEWPKDAGAGGPAVSTAA